MARIDVTLRERRVVHRDASGFLQGHLRVRTEAEAEASAADPQHLRPGTGIALMHHEVQSLAAGVTTGGWLGMALAFELQRLLRVVETRQLPKALP